jgi:hypothetical protein
VASAMFPSLYPPTTGAAPTGGLETAVHPGGTSDGTSPFSPDSGLFWFGVFLAVSLGLIAASTSIRVGPLKASASAGS